MPEAQEKLIPEEPFLIKTILKSDGRVVDFLPEKISQSLVKACENEFKKESEKEKFDELVTYLTNRVIQELHSKYNILKEQESALIPSTEEVRELIEKKLVEKNLPKAAKAYILYQHLKKEERERRALILGDSNTSENLEFSNEALKILERRYLLKDQQGNLIETPAVMLKRVAKNIAQADLLYGITEEEAKITEQQFYQLMSELKFLPNSPTLMNAGTPTQQLSSCFVLPIDDSMESIFGTLRNAAVIHQKGSGTGFSFSRLRPKNDPVRFNMGVASGPLAFLKVYDTALETIKQGGVRPGANMAVLRVDHPDIIRFIESKRDRVSLKNFNISVAVTDRFMKALEEDRDYFLTNPRTGKYYGRLRARDVFSLITQNAWKTGDPGLVFIDEINRKHPAKHLGEIETTNQCGEAPLLPYEGCVLGSINLNKFIDDSKDKEKKDLNWEELKKTIQIAVHFLDNVIDMNIYPLPEIAEQTKKSRKFGLGLMGFADILCRLKIKYDSEIGLEFAEKLISFFKEAAYEKSQELAEKRGACPAWEGSEQQKTEKKRRNMTCLSLAPTGTISLLANASASCEPFFALSYFRTLLGDNELIYLNKQFEQIAKERGFYSPELIRKIARSGSVQEMKEVPKDVREIFVTGPEIEPEWHIKMQATLQKYVDNSISKTINFPRTAAIKDVENAYLLAWKSKCKGITIYRDGSYEEQVINVGDGS